MSDSLTIPLIVCCHLSQSETVQKKEISMVKNHRSECRKCHLRDSRFQTFPREHAPGAPQKASRLWRSNRQLYSMTFHFGLASQLKSRDGYWVNPDFSRLQREANFRARKFLRENKQKNSIGDSHAYQRRSQEITTKYN